MRMAGRHLFTLIIAAKFAWGAFLAPAAATSMRQDLLRRFQELQEQGRLEESLQFAKQILDGVGKQNGSHHPNYADMLTSVGAVHEQLGQLREAEEYFREAMSVYDKTSLGSGRSAVALQYLGALLKRQGRSRESLQVARRAFEQIKKGFGSTHYRSGIALLELAQSKSENGLQSEAAQDFSFALEILSDDFSRLEADPLVGPSNARNALLAGLLNSAQNLIKLGRLQEAAPILQRTLRLHRSPLAELLAAKLKHRQGDLTSAYELAQSAVRNLRTTNPDPSLLAVALSELAILSRKTQRIEESYNQLSEAVELRMMPPAPGSSEPSLTLSDTPHDGVANLLALVSIELSKSVRSSHTKLIERAFWATQVSASLSIETAIIQMAARAAVSKTSLAPLFREKQDLEYQLQSLDRRYTSSLSSADRGAPNSRTSLSQNIDRVKQRLKSIEDTLSEKFAFYRGGKNSAPIPLEKVSSFLSSSEVAIVFREAPSLDEGQTRVLRWIIHRAGIEVEILSVNERTLSKDLKMLRCSTTRRSEDTSGECAALLPPATHDELFAFPSGAAYRTYNFLFSGIKADLSSKTLVIVASDRLGVVPYNILLTEKPPREMLIDLGGLKINYWLAARNSILHIPTVRGLGALRSGTHRKHDIITYLGVGNPLLRGDTGRFESARGWSHCTAAPSATAAQTKSAPRALPIVTTRGLADVNRLQQLWALPETIGEVCKIRSLIDPRGATVYLGENATEGTLKRQSAVSALLGFKVVHFATHGLMASETDGVAVDTAEPALVLTPPTKATAEDDGLLTAAEIMQLRLDADMVILSACNSGGGDGKRDGDIFSGLPRAFFYAGARSVLVSSWYVDSASAVDLVTEIVAQFRSGKTQSEALRLSMKAVRDRSLLWSHPIYWAPFSVIGNSKL